MAQLIAAIDDTIEVEFGQFTLQEANMARLALELPVTSEPWLAVGGPGGLLLHSAGTDHYPAVRIEMWDSEPAVNDDRWDKVADLQCHLLDDVRLQSVTADFSTRTLPVSQPNQFQVRAHVRGRGNVKELGEGSFDENVERWLIQLWPTDDQP